MVTVVVLVPARLNMLLIFEEFEFSRSFSYDDER
jgi:hypothetical protein